MYFFPSAGGALKLIIYGPIGVRIAVSEARKFKREKVTPYVNFKGALTKLYLPFSSFVIHMIILIAIYERIAFGIKSRHVT